MLQETWNTFPQQIVQKINGLLHQAQPNSLKAFQIYKMCQAEGLWTKSYSEFSFLLEGFYQIPLIDRSKSQMDQFLNRPMDCANFESVHLTFRTAEITDSEIRDIAHWAHNMLRLHYEKTSLLSSVETLSKAIFNVTHPNFDEKDQDIDFEDFCEAWTQAVTTQYGKKYESEHRAVVSELRNLDRLVKARVSQLPSPSMLERIYLTQTEIDWVERSRQAVQTQGEIPRYPLSKGPSKIQVIELLKWSKLWEMSKKAQGSAIEAKVEKLRLYIESECDRLLLICRR